MTRRIVLTLADDVTNHLAAVRCAYCYPHDCHACHGTGFRDAEHGEEPEEGMSCLWCDGSGSLLGGESNG